MVEFEVEGGVRVRIVMEGQEVIDDWAANKTSLLLTKSPCY